MKTQTSTTTLQQRYGDLGPGISQLPGPVFDLMLRHRSVRSFADRPLPPGTLEALIAAGQSAATSSNMQPVSVVAVEDPARRSRLAGLASGQAFVGQAPVVLCFLVDQSRALRVGEAMGADLFALDLMDSFVAAVGDCGIFAQSVAIAAESIGIGSCFIGNLRNDPLALARELDLPPKAFVVFGLCLGYEEPPVTGIRPRLPQSVVLHHETYRRDGQAEAADLARYDAVFAAHEQSQGRQPVKWTDRHRDRYASRAYLSGRARLKEVLHSLGFLLK